MRNQLTVFFLFIVLCIHAQKYSVETFPNRLRMSWETVSMTAEPDLGFIGIGYDLFHLVNKTNTIYVGLSSYSAITGIRPGLITLGMSAGWCPQISRKGLFLDLGAFLGGGGGGGAADGGGLIVRPHLDLEQRFGNLGVRFGVSRIDFPSGEITGNQINVGLSFSGNNYFKVEDSGYRYFDSSRLNTNKLRVALVGTQYYNLLEGSVSSKPDVDRIGLVGIQVERSINPYLYGLIKLSGAMSGGTDGYMSIFFGAGGRLPVVKNRINIESRLLFGPTGGGGIESGGGATVQAEAGLSLMFGNGYDLKLMTGKTFSPWGDFETNHVEIGLGKSFDRLFPEKSTIGIDEFDVDGKDFTINNMAFTIYNRIYLPPEATTKNGTPYLNSFNSLGFEFQKYIGEKFTINGGTVWAYQGDYGAYAEGLLGVTYYQPVFSKTKLAFKGMFGAAGGGDIDLGSGLLFQYALGLERSLNERWDFVFYVGQTQPIEGNFNPVSIDVGLKFHVSQLLKN
ncbi:hypothetical protein [Flavicella sp.]|uniref:hypothetical protein n=1 Tax=Flavicella sp. TaxID=2957742 RepID=UPI003016E1DF